MRKLEISKDILTDLYENKKLTTFQIAEKLQCCQATIWKRLHEFGIKPRLPGVDRVNVSKEDLNQLYIKEKLSTWKIESKLNIPRSTIHRKLREYKIPLRDLSDSHVIYPKKNFSGDLIEKAYLIGFRIGDLRIRKQYKNSKVICAACSSTIPEQIQLIRSLFGKYGRIWTKKANNKVIHSEAFLNNSFNFLFSKEVPNWILKYEKYFSSFLAGFVDAEGHIGVYNNMARFSLGNYDSSLLFLIHKKLREYGVECNKPFSDNRKGKKNNQGYRYNKNYWHLRLNNKNELPKLFKLIKPYIKHKRKIKDLNNAIENINNRNKLRIKKMKETFYITTPIYYTNAPPHLGSAYTTIAADVLARWKRLKGEKVFFLTGTDEHGQKIQETAEKSGKKPKKFVDEIVKDFKKAFKLLNISNDFFIRTTDKRHGYEVKKTLQKLYDKKFIYKGHYESYYCVGCEQYLTESDLVDGRCPLHNKEPELRKEEAYLFKLSKFQDKLLNLIKTGKYEILPKRMRKEIISFIESGLKDISISRLKEKVSWGIELPFDKKHTCFVWVDAFWNYLTGLKINNQFEKFWPPDIQLMARDILRVHATIWPALLLATGNKLPKTLFIHGYFTVNGQKMSKSLGNVISPTYLVKKYGADALRYFLMRNIPFGQDGDVSEQSLIERNNNELADKLGNLVSRVTSLAERYGIEKTGNKLLEKLKLKEIEEKIENYELDKALELIFAFIDSCNFYVQENKLWESGDKRKLYELVNSIKAITILLFPFIPETCEKIAKHFNFKIKWEEIKKPVKVKKINKSEILFKKVK